MLNPAVPVELAGIISRLMAKDRDRRYQTPEHLVRELLGIAGIVGSGAGIGPGGPSGTNTGIGRHGSRTWYGWCRSRDSSSWSWDSPGGGVSPSPGLNSPSRSSAPRTSELNVVTGPLAPVRRRRWPPAIPAPAPANPQPAYPRNIPVSSNEDLLEILATAPRRSVIVLSDDGPYRIGGRTWSSRSPAPLANPDLVIKAEPGVRPLVKFAEEATSSEHPLSSLLQFIGGHVRIEGLKFEMDAVLPDEQVAAIRTEDTELVGAGLFVPADQFPRRPQREPRFRCEPCVLRPPLAIAHPPYSPIRAISTADKPESWQRAPSMSFSVIARWAPGSHRSGSTIHEPASRYSASSGCFTRASWQARHRSFASTAHKRAFGSTTA